MYTRADSEHFAHYLGHILAKSKAARESITSHQQIVHQYDSETLMHVLFQYHQDARNSNGSYDPQGHADRVFSYLHSQSKAPETSYAAPMDTGMPLMVPPYSAKKRVTRNMTRGAMSPLLVIDERALEIDLAAIFSMAPGVYDVIQHYLQHLDEGLRQYGTHGVESGVTLTHTIRMMTNMLGMYTLIVADAILDDMQYNYQIPSAWQYPLFEQQMVAAYGAHQDEISSILYATGMVHAPGMFGQKAYSASLHQAIHHAVSSVQETVLA